MNVEQNIKDNKYTVTDENLLRMAWPSQYPPSAHIPTKEETRAARNEIAELHKQLKLQFKADLEEDFCVVGHIKANRLFDLAWDRGHSAGYMEVYYEYSKLVTLLN